MCPACPGDDRGGDVSEDGDERGAGDLCFVQNCEDVDHIYILLAQVVIVVMIVMLMMVVKMAMMVVMVIFVLWTTMKILTTTASCLPL